MLEAINLLLTQSFLQRALVVGLLISLCSALLGVSLVLKRFSMIGDGLSHVGFGAMAIACAANVAPLYFSLPIVLVAAFLLLRLNEKGKVKGDTAIAMISTGALAIGVMVTSMTTGMNIDIYNYMFGSILTMSNSDVVISSVISLAVAVLFIVFYNEIFAVTFDESFARATGTGASVYNMLIAGLTAVTIVIGMRMMGALLISSLIIFPAVTAMRVCKSFRSVVITSSVISVVCFFLGLLLSVEFEAPTGASIVCVNIIFLLLFSVIRFLNIKIKSRVAGIIACTMVIVSVFSGLFALSFNSFNTAESEDKISIVTVGFAEYDFARQITGEKGEVRMLLSPGEESHTFEPSPSDILLIKDSDVFICTGGESESWVNRILSSVDENITVVRMIDVCHLEKESHDHEHEVDSDHEYDEHVWTSPLNAKIIVDEIANAISESDSDNADFYIRNADAYKRKIDTLDKKFRKLGNSVKGKSVVIGDRFPLRYLMLEYGIEYHAAFSGCSAQADINPVAIAALNDLVKANSIPVVFKVDLSSGTVAQSISNETGADVDTLYSCHVVSADYFHSGETYVSLMEKNYEALYCALK